MMSPETHGGHSGGVEAAHADGKTDGFRAVNDGGWRRDCDVDGEAVVDLGAKPWHEQCECGGEEASAGERADAAAANTGVATTRSSHPSFKLLQLLWQSIAGRRGRGESGMVRRDSDDDECQAGRGEGRKHRRAEEEEGHAGEQ